jgi:hypothetical protein
MGKSKKPGVGKGNGEANKDNPTYYLRKYKTTQRPVPCERCGQNAYYKHPEWGYVCAPHLLDLISIYEAKFDWDEYKEMWDRCEQLLRRPAKQRLSTTAWTTDAQLESRPAKKARE